MLLFAISVVVLAVVYYFWVRPLLKTRPSLAHFWDREASLVAAIQLKFAGLKERLTAASIVTAGTVLELHDEIVPLISGIDTSSLTKGIPEWVWPLVTVGSVLLMLFFRKLRDSADRPVVT